MQTIKNLLISIVVCLCAFTAYSFTDKGQDSIPMTYVVLEDVVAEDDCPLNGTNTNAIPIYLSMVFLARWSTREVTVSLDWFLKESRRIFNYVSEFFKSSRMKFIKVLRDICNSAKLVVYSILFLAKRLVYTVLVFVLRNWKRLAIGAILLIATVYMFNDVYLSTFSSGVVGGGATMKTSKEIKETKMQKGKFCKPFLDQHADLTYGVDVYESTMKGLTIRSSGTKRDEASIVTNMVGEPIRPVSAMIEIRNNRDHSFAIVKGTELRVYTMYKDKVAIIPENENYEKVLKDTLGINITPILKDGTTYGGLPDLVQQTAKHWLKVGFCWTSVDTLWRSTCQAAGLGGLINIEYLMMWTFNRLKKAFRINQSDSIDQSQQGSKLAKYLSRVFRPFRFWTFDDIRTSYIKSHKDLDLAVVTDGHVGALSLHAARNMCGMRKIKVGNIVEITYICPDGLLKGLAEVVANNAIRGIDFLLYGDQWKKILSYDGSFLAIDRKKGNDVVYLESQTLGNIIPFRAKAKEWAKRHILAVTDKIVTGDIMGALSSLHVLTDKEEDLRKSTFILKRLALHKIDIEIPFVVNRVWSFVGKMLNKAGELRIEIPGSVRRIMTPDVTKINTLVGDIKKGNVVIKGDMLLISREDGADLCLRLGDGDYDDPIIIHFLKGGKVLHDDNGSECGWKGLVLLHRQPNQWGEWVITTCTSDHIPTEELDVDMSNEFQKDKPFPTPELPIKRIPGALFDFLIDKGKEGGATPVEKALRNRVPGKWRAKLSYVKGPYTELFESIFELLDANRERVIAYVNNLRLPDWMHETNEFLEASQSIYWEFAKGMGYMMGRAEKMREKGFSKSDVEGYEKRYRKRLNASIRSIFNSFDRAEKRLIVEGLMTMCYVDMVGTETTDGRIRSRMNDGVLNVPGPKCGHPETSCECYKPGGQFYNVEGIRDVVLDVLIDHGHGENVENNISASEFRLVNAIFGINEVTDYSIQETVNIGYINSEVSPVVRHTRVKYNTYRAPSVRSTVTLRGGWIQVANVMFPGMEVSDLTLAQQAKAQRSFNDSLPTRKETGLAVEVKDSKLYTGGALLAWVPKESRTPDGYYVIYKVLAKGNRVLVLIEPVTTAIREEGGLGSPLPDPMWNSVVAICFSKVDPNEVKLGNKLRIVPEPHNKKDPNAVALYTVGYPNSKPTPNYWSATQQDLRLGYIPAKFVDEFHSNINKTEVSISKIHSYTNGKISHVDFK